MSLEIKAQRSAGIQVPEVVTLVLAGSLNSDTAPELERQLLVVLAEPIKNIAFDLAPLKFITSAGLRVFAATRKTLKERGGQASFVNLQPQVEAVFDVIRSLPGVSIYKDTAALDSYLAQLQSGHFKP